MKDSYVSALWKVGATYNTALNIRDRLSLREYMVPCLKGT